MVVVVVVVVVVAVAAAAAAVVVVVIMILVVVINGGSSCSTSGSGGSTGGSGTNILVINQSQISKFIPNFLGLPPKDRFIQGPGIKEFGWDRFNQWLYAKPGATLICT